MSEYGSPKALEMAVKEAARRSSMDTNRAISGFYFHRLLCRVFAEPSNAFVLKGGLGMLARTTNARYTRDIDLATNALDIDAAAEELKTLASRDLGDFVSFRFVGWSSIKADDEYRTGYTITFDAYLGAKKKQTISVDLVADEIDCGTPDIVVPADRISIPGLETHGYPVYPAEKAIADKVCGIAERHDGRPSSRVKDLVDIVVYAQNVPFVFATLANAVKKELSIRKLEQVNSFSIPSEWGEAQARQYRKLALQTGMPGKFHDIREAENLAKKLIDPCLSTELDSRKWSLENLSWI